MLEDKADIACFMKRARALIRINALPDDHGGHMPMPDFNHGSLDADTVDMDAEELEEFAVATGLEEDEVRANTRAADRETAAATTQIAEQAIQTEDFPSSAAQNNFEQFSANQQVLVDLVMDVQSRLQDIQDEINGDSKILGVKKKYIGWFCKGIGFLTSASVLAALIYVIKWAQSQQSSVSAARKQTHIAGAIAFPPFDPALLPTVLHSATLFLTQNSSTFWTTISSYVASQKPVTLKEQLLWMNFTVDACKGQMQVPWFWQDGGDKKKMVDDAVASILSSGFTATYAAVPQWRYQSNPLPTAVAASILLLAVPQVMAQTTRSKLEAIR